MSLLRQNRKHRRRPPLPSTALLPRLRRLPPLDPSAATPRALIRRAVTGGRSSLPPPRSLAHRLSSRRPPRPATRLHRWASLRPHPHSKVVGNGDGLQQPRTPNPNPSRNPNLVGGEPPRRPPPASAAAPAAASAAAAHRLSYGVDG
jgi:hypothetical protein